MNNKSTAKATTLAVGAVGFIAAVITIALYFGLPEYQSIFLCSSTEDCIKKGRAHRDERNCKKAIKYFERATYFQSTSSEAYSLKGLCYYDINEYQVAINDLATAISLNPTYWAHYFNRGLIYKEMGNLEKAISDVRLALSKTNNKDEASKVNAELQELLRAQRR